jgi:NADPH:quinone reductase-like Zn-dependent oxidoreductase
LSVGQFCATIARQGVGGACEKRRGNAMKAVVMHEFGGPEVLKHEEIETPKAGPGDVLIEVRAVTVNRTLDMVVRENKYVRTPRLPHILGVDPSGVVVETGADVKDRKVGDRVYCRIFVPTKDPAAHLVLPGLGPVDFLGVSLWGGYAQYVRTPAGSVVPIPGNISFHDASVIGRHLATATNQLENVCKVKAGDFVLVMGATGGIGSTAIQVAKWHGATVIAAAGGDDRVAAALGIGADHGVDYRSRDLAEAVMKLTDGKGVNAVVENIADPDLFRGAINSMAPGATLVTAGNASGNLEVPLDIRRLYLRQLHVVGEPREAPGGLEKAFARAGEGGVRTLIDRVMPLSQAAEAHRRVASRGGIGKVVLDPTLD